MDALKGVETTLNDLFVKNTPALPKGFKDFLVMIVPWLSLIGGLLGLLSAWNIYRWVTSDVVDYVNDLSRAFGVDTIDRGWSLGLWIAVAVAVVTSVIYLLAFSPLRNKEKKGWDLLFYAFLLNTVYGVVIAFTDFGSSANIVGAVIGFLIGGYLLFQIREAYAGKTKVAGSVEPKATSAKK